jgi:hypothetical protein
MIDVIGMPNISFKVPYLREESFPPPQLLYLAREKGVVFHGSCWNRVLSLIRRQKVAL